MAIHILLLLQLLLGTPDRKRVEKGIAGIATLIFYVKKNEPTCHNEKIKHEVGFSKTNLVPWYEMAELKTFLRH